MIVIGLGRQSFMVACRPDVDAGIDCYGGRADVGLAPGLRCLLLGLFGADDRSPSPADVTAMAKALEANGKTFEFQSYEDAGHALLGRSAVVPPRRQQGRLEEDLGVLRRPPEGG